MNIQSIQNAVNAQSTSAAPGARGAPETQRVADSATVQTVSAPQQPSATPPSESQVKQAIDEVKRAVGSMAQDLQFSVDEDTGRSVVKVVDLSTKQVIRQIPTEEVLQIAKSLDQFEKVQGMLIKQKA